MSDHGSEKCDYTCDGCDGVYSTSFNLTKHMKKCKVIQQQQSREGYMMVIRDKDLIIESQRKEVDSLRNQVMELKIELATERARNQAQLGGFVNMAMSQHHQQPVYHQPAQQPPQQVYIQPPPTPAPPKVSAPEPIITIEAEPPAEEETPEEKPEPVKVKHPINYRNDVFVGPRKPWNINEFIDLMSKDEEDEFCCFEENDLILTFEGTKYNPNGNYSGEPISWLLGILERTFNKFTYPLSNRAFHSIKNTHGRYVLCYYDNKEWVDDNELFEKKLNTLLHAMSNILTRRIRDIEDPIIERTNAEYKLYNVDPDGFGNPRQISTLDGYKYTEVMRDAQAQINNMAQNSFKLISAMKEKFILDNEMVLQDMKDNTKKIVIKSKE